MTTETLEKATELANRIGTYTRRLALLREMKSPTDALMSLTPIPDEVIAKYAPLIVAEAVASLEADLAKAQRELEAL